MKCFTAHNASYTISIWESLFYTMNCSRRAKIYHLRIALKISNFLHANCSRRTTKFEYSTCGSIFYTMNFSRHSTNIPLEDRFSKMKCPRRTTYFHLTQ